MTPRSTKVFRLASSCCRTLAFTLIELLSVLAVIGILLAVLLPAIGKARLSATKGKDVSNLRQTGTALNLYLNDNQQSLPVSWVSFPANPTVAPRGEWQSLGGHLAPYMDSSVETGTRVFLEPLLSPAWPKQPSAAELLEQGAPTVNSYRLVLGGLGKPNPFGGKQKNSAGIPIREQSILNLTQVFDLEVSQFPILYNHDQKLPFSQPGAPEQPFYGDGRNVLYLDGHVAFETDLEFLQGFR